MKAFPLSFRYPCWVPSPPSFLAPVIILIATLPLLDCKLIKGKNPFDPSISPESSRAHGIFQPLKHTFTDVCLEQVTKYTSPGALKEPRVDSLLGYHPGSPKGLFHCNKVSRPF